MDHEALVTMLRQLQEEATDLVKDYRRDANCLLEADHDGAATLQRLVSLDHQLDSVITALNFNCKYLLSNELFQQQLVLSCKRILEIVDLASEFFEPFEEPRCCGLRHITVAWEVPDGMKDVVKSLHEKLASFKTKFSLNINISGQAKLGGEKGVSVTDHGHATRVVREDPSHKNIIRMPND